MKMTNKDQHVKQLENYQMKKKYKQRIWKKQISQYV